MSKRKSAEDRLADTITQWVVKVHGSESFTHVHPMIVKFVRDTIRREKAKAWDEGFERSNFSALSGSAVANPYRGRRK